MQDDAAGLSISEKMCNQIRVLNQAIKNSEDGISLIQTAEGNMNEIHSILQINNPRKAHRFSRGMDSGFIF